MQSIAQATQDRSARCKIACLVPKNKVKRCAPQWASSSGSATLLPAPDFLMGHGFLLEVVALALSLAGCGGLGRKVGFLLLRLQDRRFAFSV